MSLREVLTFVLLSVGFLPLQNISSSGDAAGAPPPAASKEPLRPAPSSMALSFQASPTAATIAATPGSAPALIPAAGPPPLCPAPPLPTA